MAQDVQLQQVVVDGMIVKMGGDDIRTGIICRVLHRRKGVDVLPVGQDDDSSRVLAGTAADAGTSLHLSLIHISAEEKIPEKNNIVRIRTI